MISDPYSRFYIAYPKALDTLLTRLAPKPTWNDTLPRSEKHRQVGRWSNQQINRLMRIGINDSLNRNPDLLFTQRDYPQQRGRGWQTVLLPANLRTGKNTLQISIQVDSSAKREQIITIPFWYIPEK